MKGRVFVVGSGIITAIGKSISETLHSFQHHESGIGKLNFLNSRHKDTLPVGEVKLSNAELSSLLGIEKPITRTAMLGMYAARQAVNSVNLDFKKWKCGLISATTVGGMDFSERFYAAFCDDETKGSLKDIINHECGKTTELIADFIQYPEFISTINTACSSSINSIVFASRLIEQGFLDVAIAGGTDALTIFTLNGFNSLMILDAQPCRPFDASRNGLNLGEGAGYVVLVSEKVLKESSVDPLCRISGYGNSNDAFHQTASSPDGRGSYFAMEQSLSMSQLKPSDINYINAHGTGTINNDASEGTAVQRMFGDHVPDLSSTKSFTGHTLGASGVIESIFSILSITKQCVFPNLCFQNQMPEIQFSPVTEFKANCKIQNVLSNSFGFGGNCSSIIFSGN